MTSVDPFGRHDVKSRRGGPVKQPLSRDAVVREALRQLTSNGIESMSLRKVATALETGPASLYAYVEDVNELRALVLDRALAKVELRDSAATWRERLHRVLKSYARVLAGRPGLAQLAFGTVAVGPNALRITDKLLALLEEGGGDPATCAWAVDLLVLYVTATVAEHTSGLDPAASEGPVARAIAGASERDYPNVTAVRAHLLSGTSEERFAWAVDVVLRGILLIPRSPRAGPARAGSTNASPRKRPRRAR